MVHISGHCWCSWKTWQHQSPCLAVLGGLENGWVLTAVVCLSAEPAGPRSWRYFSAGPELGIRKPILGLGLCKSSLGFLLQLNVPPKKKKKSPPPPKKIQRKPLEACDLTAGKSYV